MGKLRRAVRQIHAVDDGKNVKNVKNAKSGGASPVHPLARLLVTVFYILTVVSFGKYDFWGLAGMGLYLVATGIGEEISVRGMPGRLLPVLLLAGMAGIANPFLDRAVLWRAGGFVVTGGMVSLLTLLLKAGFCVSASYFLIMETGMEGVCYGLRRLHVPKELVTVLLLIYRYLMVLLKEAERMMQAYKLRAPGQKGIHGKAWGAFVGQLLLRSMDRAETVYESMLLRGYHGEFAGQSHGWGKGASLGYLFLWAAVFAGLRLFPVFQMTGNLLLGMW